MLAPKMRSSQLRKQKEIKLMYSNSHFKEEPDLSPFLNRKSYKASWDKEQLSLQAKRKNLNLLQGS
jgi:hypothetical protein